jgi:two-component system, LytTR family, response regulator AlgR
MDVRELTPVRTLIVDDEPLAIERLQVLCAREPLVDLVGTASDGNAALRLTEVLEPEALLLDISMPELDGMGVARALGAARHRPAVVFVTAFDSFAVEAFNLAAVDYLLKPVAPDRLKRALERVVERRGNSDGLAGGNNYVQEFWVPYRSELIRIAAEDIDRIDAERDYMRLHVGQRSYLLHQTISALEERLDPNRFIRLHRSTIVRRDRIKGLKHDGGGVWSADLGDGEEIRIGRTYLDNAKAMAGR